MFVKTFQELSNEELYEILKIRSAVFVVEQNCVYLDIDGIDPRAIHMYEKEDGEIVAYLRVFIAEEGVAQIGRVLTMKRSQGYGKKVLEEGVRYAFEELHVNTIFVEAQVYAKAFYEKVGFEVCSQEFLEDGIPHIKMELRK